MEGFLNISLPSPTNIFWNCFCDSYDANSRGIDSKIRILSIIAEKFTYKEIIKELEVYKIFDTV